MTTFDINYDTGLFALGVGFYLFLTRQQDFNSQTDFGRTPYLDDIQSLSIENTLFRKAIWTGQKMQVTLMSIPVGGEVGLEAHKNIDQFLRIEEGEGVALMGPREENLTFEQKIYVNSAVMVPAGLYHNVINTGNVPLKLYSIYGPPEHPYGTIHKTSDEADRAELEELLEDD